MDSYKDKRKIVVGIDDFNSHQSSLTLEHHKIGIS